MQSMDYCMRSTLESLAGTTWIHCFFLFQLSIFIILKTRQSKQGSTSIQIGILTGLAFLTKWTMACFIPMVIIPIFWLQSKRIQDVIVFVAIMVIFCYLYSCSLVGLYCISFPLTATSNIFAWYGYTSHRSHTQEHGGGWYYYLNTMHQHPWRHLSSTAFWFCFVEKTLTEIMDTGDLDWTTIGFTLNFATKGKYIWWCLQRHFSWLWVYFLNVFCITWYVWKGEKYWRGLFLCFCAHFLLVHRGSETFGFKRRLNQPIDRKWAITIICQSATGRFHHFGQWTTLYWSGFYYGVIGYRYVFWSRNWSVDFKRL